MIAKLIQVMEILANSADDSAARKEFMKNYLGQKFGKTNDRNSDSDHENNSEWSDEGAEEEITKDSLSKYIEKHTLHIIKLEEKIKPLVLVFEQYEKEFGDTKTELTNIKESLESEIKSINLKDIQQRTADIEENYNLLLGQSRTNKSMRQKTLKVQKSCSSSREKLAESMSKHSEDKSEENSLRKQESSNNSEVENNQLDHEKLFKDFEENNLKIAEVIRKTETLFPTLVLDPGISDENVETVGRLVESEKQNSSEKAVQLTKLQDNLKKNNVKLIELKGDFTKKKNELENKKEEIIQLRSVLDEKKLKFETLSGKLPSQTFVSSEAQKAESTSHVSSMNENLEEDLNEIFNTKITQLQKILEQLETKKKDIGIEDLRNKYTEIEEIHDIICNFKDDFEKFEINLTKQQQCIAGIESKLTEMNVSINTLIDEETISVVNNVDSKEIQTIAQQIEHSDSEIAQIKLLLAKEKNTIITIENEIQSHKIDISTAFDKFKFLVTVGETSMGSNFINLESDMEYMKSLFSIHQMEMKDILEKEKALTEQIAETNTKIKSVQVEFEKAKNHMESEKIDSSPSLEAALTDNESKTDKTPSLGLIHEEKISASRKHKSTSELAQTPDERNSTVMGNNGPNGQILPASVVPLISEENTGFETSEVHVEVASPFITTDTSHTNAKNKSSTMFSNKAIVTPLNESKSSIHTVHTKETPPVSISTTSKKHILSDTAENLRINQEETGRKQKETVASQQKMTEIQRKHKDIVEKITLAEEAEKVSPQTPAGKIIFIQLKSDLVKIEHEFKVAEKKKEEDVAKLFALTKQKEKIIDDDKRSKSSIPTPTILHSASLQAILTKLKRKPHIRDDTSYTMTQSISDVPLLMTGVDPTTIAAALTRHLLCDFHAILRDASTYDYEVDADYIAENSKSLCRVRMPNQDIMFVEIIPDEANKSNPVIQLYYQAGSKRSEIIQYRTNNIVQEWCHMLEHR